MTKRRIAALIFDGFEMLDLYGPLELFSMHRDDFDIVTVAADAGPMTASGGPATLAEAGFADGHRYDMVLVPGGRGVRAAQVDQAHLDWRAQVCDQAEVVMSVCTGSALLAAAGVLDGKRATTNKIAFDWVKGLHPAPDWQERARWVVDGKVYTSSGVSAGMDMALDVIKDLIGAQAAKDAAHWAEYIPNPDPENDPFAP